MKKFNVYFIEQLVLCILIFGVGITILSRVISTLISAQTQLTLGTIPDMAQAFANMNRYIYPVILMNHLLNAVSVVVSVFVAQSNTSKKECINIPSNPKKYYLIVSAVLIAINLSVSVFSLHKSTESAMLLRYFASQYPSFTQGLKELCAEYLHHFRIAVIIGNILQIALIFGFSPLCIKNHEKLFPHSNISS